QGCGRHSSSPGRPLQDLLHFTFAADDALDDVESAATVTGDDAGTEEAPRRAAAVVARKPRCALRFLLCFSPPRSAVASCNASGGHGKSSKSKITGADLQGLRGVSKAMAEAAYRCASAYEHVAPQMNYATVVSGKTEDAASPHHRPAPAPSPGLATPRSSVRWPGRWQRKAAVF
ncbi:unnamed protein product, partial [Urochloa humidicola]